MGIVDDLHDAEVDTIARLCIVERKLKHIIRAGEVLFAGQRGKVKRHHLVRAGASVRVRIVCRDIVCYLVPETADDDPIQKAALLQRGIKLVSSGKAHVPAVLDLDDVAIVSGRGQVVQHLIERQNAQLLRHVRTMEVCIGHFARVVYKLRRHVQCLELRQRLVANRNALRPEHICRVRNAVERTVVRENEHVVRRHAQVKFKIIHLKIRVFHTAPERRHRFLREIARAAAVGRDRGRAGDEGIVRVIALAVFRVGAMIKLRKADDPNDRRDAKQNEQTSAQDISCFHENIPPWCVILSLREVS